MRKENFESAERSLWVERAALLLAICISIVLFIAAIGKFLHPIEYFKMFDRGISLLELVGIILILVFRYHAKLWLGVSLLFSLWMGYAFYWHCLELPCGCMGTKLQLPTIFTLTLDGIFLVSSGIIAFLLGVRKEVLFLVFLGCALLALGGFVSAEWIYKHYVI